MAANIDPVLGNWYKHLNNGGEFRIVAYDATDAIVEIQHYDGDVEALELDDWYQMELEHIEPPEDWAASIDDTGNSESDMLDDNWNEDHGEWHEWRSQYSED